MKKKHWIGFAMLLVPAVGVVAALCATDDVWWRPLAGIGGACATGAWVWTAFCLLVD